MNTISPALILPLPLLSPGRPSFCLPFLKRPRTSYCLPFRVAKFRVTSRLNKPDNDSVDRKNNGKLDEMHETSPPSPPTGFIISEHSGTVTHKDDNIPPGGRNGDNYHDDSGHGDDPVSMTSIHATPEKRKALTHAWTSLVSELMLFAKQLQEIPLRIGHGLATLLRTVPPQVMVAFIGIVTAFFSSIRREKSELRKTEAERLKERNKKIASKVAEVRGNYESLEACLLKASYLLANRLIEVAEGSAAGTIQDNDKPDVGKGDSITYSTYLIARYFASVELLKKHTGVLDLGFPAADRIFSNIIGRIQGILAADDETLEVLQTSERFFKPKRGKRTQEGGALRVLPRAQVSVGELLLRSYWDKNGSSSESPSMNSILTYVEFCELLESESAMKRWCSPLRDSFRALDKARRNRKSVGARVYIAQSALLDLVDFLDPGPKCRYVPFDARRRLALGDSRFNEETRPPASLQAIYRSLGALRDGLGANAVAEMAFKMQKAPLEVFVKAPECEQPTCMQDAVWGDCPYSQTVLLLLEELSIPYRAVRIRNDDKPAWFHLINPYVRTPVVYHEGHLLSDSRAIMMYIEDRFDHAHLPCSIHESRRRVGSKRFTRFHKAFLRWLCGDERAKNELNSEMRRLNGVLCDVANRNEEGGPFFGDTRFSREDISISPFLYHTVVAGKELKKWKVPEECEAVKRYVEQMYMVDSFMKTKADMQSIVRGYGRVMREGKVRRLDLLVALE